MLNNPRLYIILGIAVLALIMVLIFALKWNKTGGRLTRLAAVAFIFIIAGLMNMEDRLLGYGLLAIGLVFAVADIIKNKSKV